MMIEVPSAHIPEEPGPVIPHAGIGERASDDRRLYLNRQKMYKHFLSTYVIATCVTGLFTFFMIFPVVVAVLPLVFCRDLSARVKYAYVVSLIFTGMATFGFAVLGIALATADSLSDFEGPNGEGAPIAPVLALAFFALLLVPWTLASMRGHQAVMLRKQEAESGRGDGIAPVTPPTPPDIRH
jgi:hypothetical protein